MLNILHSLTSDEALFLKFARGDASSFEVLYKRHKDGLFAYLYRSHVDLTVIEEVAQETWMAAINSAKDYRQTAKFRTYLFAIAHRKLVDFWRRNKHENVMVREDNEGQPIVDNLSADNNYSPSNIDLSMDLLLALESLSKEQQQAYLLKEEGFSRKEIAVMTGSNEETIKSRIRYANSHLRRLLEVQYAD